MHTFLIAAAVATGQVTPLPAHYHYLIEMALYQGDPLGSREAGTVKILSEPKVITTSGRPCILRTAGEPVAVPTQITWRDGRPNVVTTTYDIGTTVEVLPIGFRNGAVFLEVRATMRTVNPGRGVETSIGFVPGFNHSEVSWAKIDRPNKPHMFRLAAESPTDQTWAVVTVKLVDSRTAR